MNDLEWARQKAIAASRGWKVPVNDALPRDSWLHYWKACRAHERDPSSGRPVPPHRSG